MILTPLQKATLGDGNQLEPQIAESPSNISKKLFTIVIELCQSSQGRNLVRENLGLNDGSIDVFRKINTQNLRNFLPFFTIGFEPAYPPDTLIDALQNPQIFMSGHHTFSASKEERSFHRFIKYFWLSAMRQASADELVTRLIYGLPRSVTTVLKKTSLDNMMDFCDLFHHKFIFRISPVLLQSIPLSAVSTPLQSAKLNAIKLAYCLQNSACFRIPPEDLSTTISYHLLDISTLSSHTDEYETIEPSTDSILRCARYRRQNDDDLIEESSRNPIQKEWNMRKEMLAQLMLDFGLTRPQVISHVSIDIWRLKQGSIIKNNGTKVVDSRNEKQRKKLKTNPEFSIIRTLLISIYLGLMDDSYLDSPDFFTFEKTYNLLMQTPFYTALHYPKLSQAQAWEILHEATQDGLEAQVCPNCKLVTIYEKESGEWEEKNTIHPCPFCAKFKDEKQLRLLSRFMSMKEEIPDDIDRYIFKA